jgi:hypothetical protein
MSTSPVTPNPNSTTPNYVEILAEIAPIALELGLKLMAIANSVSSGTATNASLDADATAANNEVIAKVNTWLASKGLPTS